MKFNKIQDKLLKLFSNKNRVLYSALLRTISKSINNKDIDNTVNTEIHMLARKQRGLVDDILASSYILINKDKRRAYKILKEKWNDTHYSKRLYKDKIRLKKAVLKEISRGINNKDNNEEIIKRISKRLDISLNNARRLVNTEMTAVMNIAEAEKGLKEGKTKYKFVATIDDRTSALCEKLNGEIFDIKDMKIGINMAPLHPNCRSRIELVD